ncbi:unnamed protein product, partial [Rotaria sordida]
MALSLMPTAEVEKQFKRIHALASPSLDDLFVYFEPYNRRFGTRIMKKHPNFWSFIQLIQDEHLRFEHIIIQLASRVSGSKPSTNKTAFQRRFETLNI